MSVLFGSHRAIQNEIGAQHAPMRPQTCNVLNRCADRVDHSAPCRSSYRGWPEDAAWLAIVHVPSHSRQRQSVVTVVVSASVSMILPVQKGQLVGRETAPSSRDSDILPLSLDRLAAATAARDLVTRRERLVAAAGSDSTGAAHTYCRSFEPSVCSFVNRALDLRCRVIRDCRHKQDGASTTT
jgi:hypothetical protein